MTRFLVFFLDQLQIGVQTVPNAMFYLLSSIFRSSIIPFVLPSFHHLSILHTYIHTYIYIYIYIYINIYIHTVYICVCVCMTDGFIFYIFHASLPPSSPSSTIRRTCPHRSMLPLSFLASRNFILPYFCFHIHSLR